MTSTRSSSTNTKTRSATRRLESFRQRFGDGHFYLACHAALPLALTPDLLYSLWANFQRDTDGEAIDIPWIAVADLMLSNLCKEVGNELYEMDQAVRDELLNQLKNDSRFGLERLRALADFVMAYVEQQLDSPDLDVRDLATGQKWRALAYKHPSEAAHSIATVLAQLPFDDKAEWIRMAALLNSLAEPLAAFQPLLNYIRAMADLARGNLEAATAQMTQAVDANREVRVEGVNLPIPEVLNGTSPKSKELDALPTSSPNRLKMPIAIAGATVVLLLMLIGVQYGLRSPGPQKTPDVTSSATPSPQAPSPPISPSPSPRTTPTPQVTPSASLPVQPISSATPSPQAPSPPISPSPSPRTTPTPQVTPSASLPVQPTPSSSTSKPSPSNTLLPQSSPTSTQKAGKVQVPNVTGISWSDGQAQIKGSNLEASYELQADGTPDGKIISQNPRPGTFVEPGARVSLVLVGAYGANTCLQGYVWREAFSGDVVCVTPETRTQAARDNAQAAARRNPNGGANTCLQGYVWREAFSGDVVCVTPETRTQAARDNAQAAARRIITP